MYLNLNPWLALLLGVFIGGVLAWLLEMWYFRRRRLESESRLTQVVEARLPAVETETPTADAVLEAPQAEASDVGIVLPSVEIETPEVELASAQEGIATPAVEVAQPALAPLAADESAPEVEAAGPAVEIKTVVAASAVELQPEASAVDVAQPVLAPLVAALAAAEIASEDARPTLARSDDLVKLKGIGPKFAAQLREAGITSFAALAAADPQRIREIIQAPAWRQVDYSAWIAQAATLAGAAPRSVQGDDFTQIDGIGPTYAAKLRSAGITIWAQLAEADETQLAKIIDAPTWRRPNYGAWIAQAKALPGEEGPGHGRGSPSLLVLET